MTTHTDFPIPKLHVCIFLFFVELELSFISFGGGGGDDIWGGVRGHLINEKAFFQLGKGAQVFFFFLKSFFFPFS